MNREKLDSLQAVLGYSFCNKDLLVEAFTHSSYSNEHGVACNERLEFLGDCVLNFLVGERLFLQYPEQKEGALTARRAAIVSKNPLKRIVDELGLWEYVRLGAGMKKTVNAGDKLYSDVFEAILGAIYLDGGLDSCRELLDRLFYPNVTPETDYKSALQEYAHAHRLDIEYFAELCNDQYVCTVKMGGAQYVGKGKNKHNAEIAAARAALAAVNKTDN